MQTLVTGATGFVGNSVARALLDAGHRVRVLSRPNSDRRTLADLSVELVEGDLLDPASLSIAMTGCQGVFHVAADYRLWVPDPSTMYATNVDATRSLIRTACDKGVERVVYTSSVATLKVGDDGSVADESARARETDMIGHYKRSKYLAQQAVGEEIARGAPVVIVSPSAPIGPRDIKPTPTGKILVDAANGKMPAYLDTGLNVVHVDDVANGHLLAFERGAVGENYILGGEDMLLKDILDHVAAVMGRSGPRWRLSPGMVKPIAVVSEWLARLSGREPLVPLDGVRMAEKKMFFSHAKARHELGYTPRAAVEAIRDALDWFADNGYIKKPHQRGGT